jgi:hypothetical protein
VIDIVDTTCGELLTRFYPDHDTRETLERLVALDR